MGVLCCKTKPLFQPRRNIHLLKRAIDISKYEYKNTKIFIPPVEKAFVCKVYDGDTFTIAKELPWDKTTIYRFSVRVKGIDCPELRTKNESEKKMALVAKHYLIDLLKESDNWVNLQNITYDKYGRLCAYVFINNKSLSDEMIKHRLAVVYDGGTKLCPKDWERYYKNGSYD
jgi:micrococcal nuclease